MPKKASKDINTCSGNREKYQKGQKLNVMKKSITFDKVMNKSFQAEILHSDNVDSRTAI